MTRSRGPVLLPQQRLTELFERGSIPHDGSRYPSYTKRNGDAIVLRPRALREPSVFITAFRDYVRSLNIPDFPQKKLQALSSDVDWWRHLRDCEHVLRRERSAFRKILTKENVKMRVNGQSAEFLAAKWMRNMCAAFNRDQGASIALQEWTHEERGIVPLGGAYCMRPLKKHNFVLMEGGADGPRKDLQELDMLVRIDENVFYFIDVSTSHPGFYKKLESEQPAEARFMAFREKMLQLLAGRQQPRVAKMHIICTDERRTDDGTVVVDKNGTPGVIVGSVPFREVVRETGKNVIRNLRDLGILKPDANGVYQFKQTSLL